MLSEIQLEYCYSHRWDGTQRVPLRITEHPYALYAPGGKDLDSRHSSPEAAAMINAWRFNGQGVVVIEDIFGRKAAVDLPSTFYDNLPKSRKAIKEQRRAV